ncbi:MAG: ATP-dependent Clp protease proteolytic subunit [Clostridia bacterium]|nr:ATP-dependent Clp protease proteolytic subunit [Clostridia bacterium]
MEENKKEFDDEIKIARGQTSGKEFSCVPIIGQIEGHYAQEGGVKATKYDHIIPLLVALDENPDVHGILILINTLGGDVEAGLAIAEVIASLNTPTVSVVLGGGHSIGVPLAVSAKRSFIVESATMTIHPVRTTGTILGVPQAFHYLEKMQDRIIRFIISHSKIQEDTLRRMLSRTDMLVNDVGTVLDGEEAVNSGLIDCVGGIKESIQALKEMMNK